METVFIRTETWDLFEAQDGVAQLPNYESFNMISSVGSITDYRVVPRYRGIQEKASQWSTHYAIISRFLKSNKTHLFICEDTLELTEENVSQIKQLKQEGVVLLDQTAKAYIIDRKAAQTIIDNCYTFYESLHAMFMDMQSLGLVKIEEKLILQKIKDYNLYFNVATALFIICMLLIILALFNPNDWFQTSSNQHGISLAEMPTAEEAVMSTEGAGMSGCQYVSLYDVD